MELAIAFFALPGLIDGMHLIVYFGGLVCDAHLVYRWRRRSHGSVGLGILLANLVHPSLGALSLVVIAVARRNGCDPSLVCYPAGWLDLKPFSKSVARLAGVADVVGIVIAAVFATNLPRCLAGLLLCVSPLSFESFRPTSSLRRGV